MIPEHLQVSSLNGKPTHNRSTWLTVSKTHDFSPYPKLNDWTYYQGRFIGKVENHFDQQKFPNGSLVTFVIGKYMPAECIDTFYGYNIRNQENTWISDGEELVWFLTNQKTKE